MWFLSQDFTTGPDSAEVTLTGERNTPIADLGSVVKFRDQTEERLDVCQVLQNICGGHAHVSWM